MMNDNNNIARRGVIIIGYGETSLNNNDRICSGFVFFFLILIFQNLCSSSCS